MAEAKKKTLKEVHFIIDQIKINKGQLLLLEEKREKLANKIVVRNADSTRKGLIERGLTKMIALLRDDLKKELNDVDKEIDFHRSELETLKKVHQESF